MMSEHRNTSSFAENRSRVAVNLCTRRQSATRRHLPPPITSKRRRLGQSARQLRDPTLQTLVLEATTTIEGLPTRQPVSQ